MKKCAKCLSVKNFTEFFVRKASKDGYQTFCKLCDAERRKFLKNKDPEKEKQYQKEYRIKNLEKKKENDRKYYIDNKESMNEKMKIYYENNKEKIREINKKWAEENKEWQIEYNRQRRIQNGEEVRERRRQDYINNKHRYVANARLREKHIKIATPQWADLDQIYQYYKEREKITKETGILHHVDHIIPLRGKYVSGLHVEYNLHIIPADINLSKSNKVFSL